MKDSMAHAPVSDERSRPGRWKERVVLVLGTLIFFIFGYDLLALGAVTSSLLNHPTWHVTSGLLGMMNGVTALGAVLGAFVANRLSAAYGPRSLIAVCVGWISGCMLLTGLAPSLLIFGASRILVGVGLGVLAPLVCALVIAWSPIGRRSLYGGIAQSGIPLGGVAAASADHTVLAGLGYQWVFIAGVLPILLVPACRRLIPVEEPHEAFLPDRATRQDARVVTREWWGLFEPGWLVASIVFSTASVIGLLLIYGASSWLPSLLAGAGYDLGSTLEFVVAFNGGAVAITLAFSMIAERVPPKYCIGILFLVAAAAIHAVTVLEGRLAILAMVALAGGGILGAQNVMCSYAARYYPYEMRGTALGFILGVGRFGSIIGPSYLTLLIGVASDPGIGLYALVTPALVGAAAVVWIPRGRRRAEPATA
ncbi:MFS transporter [Streptomyces chartreusis]|uniref:MFS transporter n=1 Tax=Streptomyces chartreusis TaxID=1969 RepID=UPI0036A25706